MLYSQIVKVSVSVDEVKKAIVQAQSNCFIDNLRDRHPNVSFDSKLRGYIGENGLKKWFAHNGIVIDACNHFPDGLNMDIDFEYKGLDIELKTSLIPDKDGDLKTVFNKRDIKLIKREQSIEDLKGDIHIQVYYQHRTNKKDKWLKAQEINLESDDVDYVYKAICGKAYLDKTFLFCWIDKPTLIKKINALPLNKRTWSFGQRSFWVCPLKDCFPPNDLIKYLQAYE